MVSAQPDGEAERTVYKRNLIRCNASLNELSLIEYKFSTQLIIPTSLSKVLYLQHQKILECLLFIILRY